jgi:N-acetylglucosaminyldiphosphoundecaprenol N-acetyl-beta-D-mannosaminyltransferase
LNPAAEDILSFKVSRLDVSGCLQQISSWLSRGDKGKYFVLANSHSLHIAKTDHVFSEAIVNADLVLPDGIGIIMASRLLGGGIRRRITGSDIFASLSSLLNDRGGVSYFFLGSTDENLAGITKKMKQEYPNITVAGTYSPPFKDGFSNAENDQMIEIVNKAKPDVLWVGMTAPRQEKWTYCNRDRLDVRFIGSVGALFDFFTGRARRSGPWFQRHGLEWLPRLCREPRRLWRRNFISNPAFMIRVIDYRLFRTKISTCA